MVDIVQYYNNLSEREQKLIQVMLLGIVFVTIFLVITNISIIFKPSLRTEVESDKEKFEQLLPKIQQLQILKSLYKQPSKLPGENIYQFTVNSIPKLPTIKREEPEINEIVGENTVKANIQYKAVAFDELLKWLDSISRKYGVIIEKSTINQVEGKPGYVSVDIVLAQN